ncbi:MAG: chorismate mutase [Lachnospiraceae bacterium]|nr:chorismate mutase [Lachnospiraceae bacterium]
MERIEELRKNIDEIDKKMAALFEERMKVSYGIGMYKKANGIPVKDVEREKKVIKNNSKYIKDPSIRGYYEEFITDIMHISKVYQQKQMGDIRISYSGIEGSFASIACSKIMPMAQRISYGSFADAYDAVVKNECDMAVLPIENSFAGEVGQVTDLIFGGDLVITGIYELPISHCLLGPENSTRDSIKTVISHPQAISQCNKFIERNHLRTIPYENTAIAAKEVADRNDITMGAIASISTAKLYGLKILEYDINDSKDNITRFAVLKKYNGEPADPKDNTFILMFTVKNAAGTLARAISVMGEHGFSMRVIRSRPLKKKNWQYFFYAEVEGKISSKSAEAMIADLKKECEFIKIIGTFNPGVKL